MHDLANLLSDLLSYMSAGWRSRSRSVRWLVRGITVALVVGFGWMLWSLNRHV